MSSRPQTATHPSLPHSIRVVALGDSLAYGAGDESGKGISGRLRDALRADGIKTVETVNLGVNGAQTSDLEQRLRQDPVRKQIAEADAIVLSIGANDLFRSPHARDETLRDPLSVADQILSRIDAIVRELHTINPQAQILILGGYNPVPHHPYSTMIDSYLGIWDQALAHHFENDDRVAVVKISDIVVPERLSRIDNFHPGAAAYEAMAERIASMLVG